MKAKPFPVICVLAHNEENNISSTLQALCDGNRDSLFSIKVYANGCTDRTHERVRNFTDRDFDVELVTIPEAGKPNAWNIAFFTNTSELLFFCDGDIEPVPGAVTALTTALNSNERLDLASCKSTPSLKNLTPGQYLVALMQLPARQDFLVGHFYALRRSALLDRFKSKKLEGIPKGVAGEDAFLDSLLPSTNVKFLNHAVYYRPPSLDDYYRYLARIRWQNEQLEKFYSDFSTTQDSWHSPSMIDKLVQKVQGEYSWGEKIIRFSGTCLRLAFKRVKYKTILREYRKLGIVRKDGINILGDATRSRSVK